MTGEQAVSFPKKKYKYNSFGEWKSLTGQDAQCILCFKGWPPVHVDSPLDGGL